MAVRQGEIQMVINTDADVLRVIRENPRLMFQVLREDEELLDEVRRLVLTEEILAMPGQLAEVIETQKKMLKDQAEMRRTQNEMLETQTKILADQAEMRQTQINILAELADLRRKYEETRRVYDRMDGRLGNLYGADLERRLPRILPSRLFGMLELHRPAVLLRDAVEPDREFLARIQDATTEGVISMDDYDRLTETDLILQARFRESGEIVYCSAEASGVIDSEDVNRAIRSAEILNTVYGERAIPVVAGYNVTETGQTLADTCEVIVIILNQR